MEKKGRAITSRRAGGEETRKTKFPLSCILCIYSSKLPLLLVEVGKEILCLLYYIIMNFNLTEDVFAH
jgi:hypothetical protein